MKAKFATALTLLLLCGCTATSERPVIGINKVKIPDWARTGNHPDYPRDQFLQGVGYSRGALKATNQAVENLQVQISAYALERGFRAIKGSRFETLIKDPAQWFDAAEFDRAVHEDRATDGFDFVVVKAINKDDLHSRARLMLPKAKRALDEAIAPIGMIGNVPDALQKYADWFVLNVRVVCLQLLTDGSLDRPVFEVAEEAAITLWEFPTLATILKEGEGQRARIRSGLPKPIGLQVIYRSRVVSGLPLKWALVAGQMGGVKGDLLTDETGKASATVMQVSANGESIGFVQAWLDLPKLAGRQIGVSMPGWLWQVKLPHRDGAAIRLTFNETSNDEARESKFDAKFRKWATANGYTVLEPDAAEDGYDWVLDVTGELAIKTWMQDEIPQVRVSGEIAITDTSNGRVLFRLNPGGIGAGSKGNTEISVSLRAQTESADNALTEVTSRIKSFLPGPESFEIKR
ncbi:hypothetical protein OAU50_01595 [Planctomycetota bacterium]|nr:hypothetical protein [Planctomycetota bacterium]